MKGVILISGNGSNLQSIIDQADSIDLQISAVISNEKNAYGLERAKAAGIKTYFVDPKLFTDRVYFDQELVKIIDSLNVELIVLAGFMRILSTLFIDHFSGKVLNIHPSLLPKYPGLNTHQRAINASDKHHGATVHFVTKELDEGPIIEQMLTRVDHNYGPDQLVGVGRDNECMALAKAVKYHIERRVFLDGNKTVVFLGS